MNQAKLALQIVNVEDRAAFSVGEAARFLGISVNTLRKRSDAGIIQARRDENGRRVFLLGDLRAYLKSLPKYRPGGNPRDCRKASTGR